MIAFQDFVPDVIRQGGFLTPEEREPLANVAMRAGAWIDHHNIDLVNIETVLLPNIHDRDEDGSTDPILDTSGEMRSQWYQVIRVWYRY